MADLGDGPFHQGDPVWVMDQGGSERAAKYVGEGELSAWFGGASTVMVVYDDTGEGDAVDADRVVPREV